MSTWRSNRQTIAWFVDLYRRGLLDRDPPYQRRSVWNLRYKKDFVETVMLGYPAPSLFLHEEVSDSGISRHAVVDGKQRLTAIFEFIEDEFPTSSHHTTQLAPGQQGIYFSDFTAEDRKQFFAYELTVEYVPSTQGSFLNEVFDRLNRNVAKLSRQELRHARYSGDWAKLAEELAVELIDTLGSDFPRISTASRLQMKDVEYTAQLMVLADSGPTSLTQDGLDQYYADRDDDWNPSALKADFRKFLRTTEKLASGNAEIRTSRFRNQVDFYSLFGAIRELELEGESIDPVSSADALVEFGNQVDELVKSDEPSDLGAVSRYHFATRSAANNVGSRKTRVEILKSVLLGE